MEMSSACCRCCLLTTGEMKDMKEAVVQVSNLIFENNVGEEGAKTEVLVYVNLLEALGQIGVKNETVEASWHQICADCEQELQACLAFQQKCFKSMMILQSIKAEEETMVEYLIEAKDEVEEDVNMEPVVDVRKRRTGQEKLQLLEIEPHDYEDNHTAFEVESKMGNFDEGHEYECKACNQRFTHPKYLSAHVRTHSHDSFYHCPACGLPKKTALEIVQHRDEEHVHDEMVAMLFPCHKCRKIFCKRWTFESHKCTNILIESLRSELKYTCQLCDQEFVDKEQYDCHSVICQTRMDYSTCKECNIKFHNRRTYWAHQRAQHRPKEFICEICSRAFAIRKYLQAHAYSHSNQKTEQCDVCAKFFKTKFQLANHKKIHKERQFECAKCAKRFPSKDILKVHLFKHFKFLSRVKCPQCDKIFMGATQLRLHQRVHIGDKSFQCELCNKFYYTHGALKYHNEKVHQEKRYQCKFCDRKFAAIKSIHEHAFTHKDHYPFNCTECERKFTRKDAFKKHLKDHSIVYDEELHGYHGETFREVVMFVLKDPKIEFTDVEAVVEEVVETT